MKLPREHGAWAMLLLPFLASIILARDLTWTLAPALLAALALFILRDAIAETYRRKYIWKRSSPELTEAIRTSAVCCIVLIACTIWLFTVLPPIPMAVLGAAACVLMVAAVYLTAHNRQRSLALQIASAAGLTGSAFIARLAAGRAIDATVWILWAVLFTHSAASMITVHARLEARIAARKDGTARQMRKQAAIAQAALLAVAIILAAKGKPLFAGALILSAAVHIHDLVRLYRPDVLRMRLQAVGLRELALSCVIAAVTVTALF